MTTVAKKLIDMAEVRQALDILIAPGQVAELRILNATTQSSRYPYTASGYFNDTEAFTKELATLRTWAGAYITLQPCKRDLLARAQNRLRSAEGMKKDNSTTADNHILQYRWLLIDCDPERPAGISSSNEEHEAALARSIEIQRVLHRLEWPEPVRADSGNGAHLLYRIDLPVTDVGLVQRVLVGLAGMFDSEGLNIDLKVYNPARISKLYGTLACKGDDTDERPHRMSRILETPATLNIVPRTMLEAMAAPEQPKRPAGNQTQTFDIEQFIQENHLDVSGPKPWNGGDKWVFNVCPWNSNHTDRSAYILKFPSGAIAAGCQHNGCSGLKWKDLRQRYEPAKGKRARTENTQDYDFTDELKDALNGNGPGPKASNKRKSNLPDVILGGQLRDTTSSALKALEQAEQKKPTIFVQTGRYTLVRVCKDKKNRPVLTPMGVPEIKRAMTESANYGTLKENKREGGFDFIDMSPPKEVAEQLLSLPPADWPFRGHCNIPG